MLNANLLKCPLGLMNPNITSLSVAHFKLIPFILLLDINAGHHEQLPPPVILELRSFWATQPPSDSHGTL